MHDGNPQYRIDVHKLKEGSIRIYTRCLRKENEAWEGWAVRPGATPTVRRTYYHILGESHDP